MPGSCVRWDMGRDAEWRSSEVGDEQFAVQRLFEYWQEAVHRGDYSRIHGQRHGSHSGLKVSNSNTSVLYRTVPYCGDTIILGFNVLLYVCMYAGSSNNW